MLPLLFSWEKNFPKEVYVCSAELRRKIRTKHQLYFSLPPLYNCKIKVWLSFACWKNLFGIEEVKQFSCFSYSENMMGGDVIALLPHVCWRSTGVPPLFFNHAELNPSKVAKVELIFIITRNNSDCAAFE